MEKENIKKVFNSKLPDKVLYAIIIVIISMLIFLAGIVVGFHKASFGRAWGEHYKENFGVGNYNGNMLGMGKLGMMDGFPNAHGAIGEIIKVELPNIIVQDKNDVEKMIFIGNNTKIQKGKIDIMSANLKIDDFVVIIGTPNDQGIIEARLIRLIPNPESL